MKTDSVIDFWGIFKFNKGLIIMSNEKSDKKINFEEAAELIKKGVAINLEQLSFDINEQHRKYLDSYQDPDESSQSENSYPIYETKTLLHVAIQEGNIDAVRNLLNNGANLTTSGEKIIYVRKHKELKSSSAYSFSAQWEESESVEVTHEKSTEALVIEKNNPGILIEIIKFNEEKSQRNSSTSSITSTLAQVKFRELKLYPFANFFEAQQAENAFQTYVNDRFFRRNKFNKALKPNKKADLLVKAIEAILTSKINNKIRDDQLEHKKGNNTINFYIQNAVVLDNLSTRSIILALTHMLNKNGHIPTLIFKVGKNHILCTSNSTTKQKGNVNVQAINPDGTIKFLPSVYGDGNGNPKYSIAEKLKKITQTSNNNILELMKSKSRKVSSFSPQQIANEDNAFFLDQLNFLHSVIEVARRGYYKANISDLDKLPVGISQARTSQLLIDGQINIDQAYGLDDKEEFYPSQETLDDYDYKKESPTKTSPKAKYKAPYNAVSGKDLENSHEEVKRKIERINAKYNERYSNNSSSTPFIIEGRNLMRQNLGEQYGSDGESSGGDYSDDESLSNSSGSSKLQFFKPEKSSKGYALGQQKTSLKVVRLSRYQKHNFSYVVQNGNIINNFLESMSLRRGEATTKDNNCLLHSYFQNIQNFFESNYPNLVLKNTDFPDFVAYIRNKLKVNQDAMLSANDEEQGPLILKAIQEYLQKEKFSGKKFRFNLEVLFADRDGDVGIVDNLNAIENGIEREQEQITIPLQIIQVGSNHYEPIFINLSGQHGQRQQATARAPTNQ